MFSLSLLLLIGLCCVAVLTVVVVCFLSQWLGALLVVMGSALALVIGVLGYLGTARDAKSAFHAQQQQVEAQQLTALAHEAIAKAQGDHEAGLAAPSDGPPAPPVPSVVPEVVTDQEMAAIASPDPQIDLGEELAGEVPAGEGEVADWGEVRGDEERPDWVEREAAPNQQVIVSGPYTTPTACREDARRQLAAWVNEGWSDGEPAIPESAIDLDELAAEQRLELRETSVGPMYLLYTLAEVDDALEDRIAQARRQLIMEDRRERGVRRVTFAGGGLLTLVTLTHLLLRRGATANPS